MISKNAIKFINSLKLKKNRNQEKVFVAEGIKIVSELLASDFKISSLFCNEEAFDLFSAKINPQTEITVLSDKELERISSLKTPQKVLAIVRQADYNLDISQLTNSLSLFLDDVNDPGNLGTIIRIANWFGIENIICSEETVDVYNSKVIQSTMGAIAGPKIFYVNKLSFFEELKKLSDFPIFGTLLEGENIYSEQLSKNGLIILGSESQGISTDLIPFITKKLYIPNFSSEMKGAESLNVAVAAAITCSEFKRKFQ